MKKHLLVIEDDVKIVRLLRQYLENFNYRVSSAFDGVQGLQQFKQEKPDLVILDIMLPGINGYEVLKSIRKNSDTPVIMLTARGEVSDRIVGLELGADDYLPKPFEPRELVARIESIFRRMNKNKKSKYIRTGMLEIDVESHLAKLSGKMLDLTTKEFEILLLFARNPGKVLNRDQIMGKVRGIDWDADNRSIDVLISRVRQKLGDDPRNSNFIKTIWGAGYKFIGDEGA